MVVVIEFAVDSRNGLAGILGSKSDTFEQPIMTINSNNKDIRFIGCSYENHLVNIARV